MSWNGDRTPECSVVTGAGRKQAPLLQSDSCGTPLPNIRCRHHGTANPLPEVNRYVVVFQDFLVSSLSGHLYSQYRTRMQIRIAWLLAEEVVPVIGVPEALLSDRGTNLLAHVCAVSLG